MSPYSIRLTLISTYCVAVSLIFLACQSKLNPPQGAYESVPYKNPALYIVDCASQLGISDKELSQLRPKEKVRVPKQFIRDEPVWPMAFPGHEEHEGWVYVNVLINEKGIPICVQAVKSSFNDDMNVEAAMATVMRWKWEPPVTFAGKPSHCLMTYKLQKDRKHDG